MTFELVAIKALLLALGYQIILLILAKDGRWLQFVVCLFLVVGIVCGFVSNGVLQQYFNRGVNRFLDVAFIYIISGVALILRWREQRSDSRKIEAESREKDQVKDGTVTGR